jgi:putative tricarboxylic transport membrane protein
MAAALWVDAERLPPPHIGGVGPSAALRLVAVLLVALGAAHLLGAWRRRGAPAAAARGNRAALAWVMAALTGLMAVMHLGGGFVLGSTWLFVATARGFGERFSPKSVGLGAGLCVAVYLFFTRALSLALPAGPLERLLLG